MVVSLVLDSELKGAGWKCTKTALPPQIVGSFVTAAIAVTHRRRKIARRTELMLRRQKATAVLISRHLEIMLPSVTEAVDRMGIPRIKARDYAFDILCPMLERAAKLCAVELPLRKIVIIDDNADKISYDLLLSASKCSGFVTVMTAKGSRTDNLTERIMRETGFAVHTTSPDFVKADVAGLLDCNKSIRVVTRIAIDMTKEGARIVDGHTFNTMTLTLPPELALPKQLT